MARAQLPGKMGAKLPSRLLAFWRIQWERPSWPSSSSPRRARRPSGHVGSRPRLVSTPSSRRLGSETAHPSFLRRPLRGQRKGLPIGPWRVWFLRWAQASRDLLLVPPSLRRIFGRHHSVDSVERPGSPSEPRPGRALDVIRPRYHVRSSHGAPSIASGKTGGDLETKPEERSVAFARLECDEAPGARDQGAKGF